MNFKIKEIKDKNIWESFLLKCGKKTFLQSWNWGEFQKKEGNKIWRLGIFENNKEFVSATLVVKIKAKRGTFLFVPHGPVLDKNAMGKPDIKYNILKTLLEELKKIAREESVNFIRISPILERNEENIKIFKDLGFREAPIHMHPELTWELDIAPSEEEILMKMRKTTRYLIRQAQKNPDIRIIRSPAFAKASAGRQNIEDLKIFNEIYQETSERHHFVPFSLDYLKNQFSSFIDDQQILIFLGKYKDEFVSAGVFVFWQNIGFYHHGASLSKYNKIPISHLLQWEAIKEAKKRGCKSYNFWGIAPSDKKNHPWTGLTLFKMGFGGYKKELVKTQDFIISQKYWLNYFIEKIRKIKRNL